MLSNITMYKSISVHFELLKQLNVAAQYSRCFSTTLCNFKFGNMKLRIWRQQKMLRVTDKKLTKRITFENQRHNQWLDTEAPWSTVTTSYKRPHYKLHNHKRAEQLSFVLYEHVNNLISAGEIEPVLKTKGFRVHKVQMARDMSRVLLYWVASGGREDQTLDRILPEFAEKLRHELICQHIMGRIPPLQFVKDLSIARVEEVEKLLEEADMGEDYENTESAHAIANTQSVVARLTNFIGGEGDYTRVKVDGDVDHIVDSNTDVDADTIKDNMNVNYTNLTDVPGFEDMDEKSSAYGINHKLLSKKLESTKSLTSDQNSMDGIQKAFDELSLQRIVKKQVDTRNKRFELSAKEKSELLNSQSYQQQISVMKPEKDESNIELDEPDEPEYKRD